MPQQKSTKFLAAKVANFGVVMAEMVGRMSEMEKEIKRLRHHDSVLSKRNHQLMKDGKSRAASSIASDASLSEEEDDEEENVGKKVKITVVVMEKKLAEIVEEIRESRGQNCLTKKLRGVVERARGRGVVAESVALVEEAEVAVPVAVKIEGSKKRRADGSENGVEEVVRKDEEVLIAPLGPRAVCGGLLRRVRKESVFVGADLR